ncbi:hypothetical protein ACO0K0_01550 [Undibacterium sp. SXout11W]
MNKQVLHTGLIALGAFAIAYFIQTNFMQVPVIGTYLPGGKPSAT